MMKDKYVPITHNISRKPTRLQPGAPVWVQRALANELAVKDTSSKMAKEGGYDGA